MNIKKIGKWIGIVLLVIIAISSILYFNYLAPAMSKMKQTEIIQLDKNITIITGGGGNSGIINSDSLVVVIDTKMDDAAEMLYKMVLEISGNKPVLVINTHWHPDHVGGNAFYKNTSILAGGSYSQEEWTKEAGKESMPTQWVKDKMIIPMVDDTLIVFNLAKNVHTPSDVMVYMPQHKLFFGGDVILNKQAPVLMGKADGNAYMDVLNDLPKKLNIQTIVPGHGAIGGVEIIASFNQFFVDMKTAAAQPDTESALIEKYKDWTQIPLFMSPGAAVSHFKKQGK